jgi:hypothetical protein
MLNFDLFTSYLEKKSSRGGGGAAKSKKKRKEALIKTERLIHFTFAWKEMRGIDPVFQRCMGRQYTKFKDTA